MISISRSQVSDSADSEYPVVDGHHSIDCYLDALSHCYKLYVQRQGITDLSGLADFFCFHVPFAGMARKAFTRLVYDDVMLNPDAHGSLGQTARTQTLDIKERQVQSMFQNYSEELWTSRAQPSMKLSANLGNIYTGSLYLSLISVLSDPTLDVLGKRICMFSYGSGLASTLFTLYVRPEASSAVQQIRDNCALDAILDSRIKLSPEEYNRRMDQREIDFSRYDYKPTDSFSELTPGTFYLERVDEQWRRFYAKKLAIRSKL
jgi:hydroxymethylglutaryl-CoA synthase